ncbi:MAG: thioredoxin family protein [Candidatus Cloacimonadales bacterium]|nr:thioredoxin family protein [Candidatus Cloacimonadota bacterium]MDD2651026.1 thioredoxin family protein [Candidatus Cloacimonadota bacterium]MDX9977910.1 thioredoxin family protein [Candidatus Cloacimonadales bacterium]
MINRLIVSVLFLSLFMVACAKDSPNTIWLEDYNQAIEIAKERDLPILINFTGSDWCIWCKRLASEVFDTEIFINYANENLILLKLDFPQKISQSEDLKRTNRALAQKYGIQGFPTIVLIDSNQKEINRTGYQQGGAESYITHLKTLLSK